jgi:UDP-glucose 4-epimerase
MWDISMRGERVLITCGAGAVGSNLVDSVVYAGAREVVVLNNWLVVNLGG